MRRSSRKNDCSPKGILYVPAPYHLDDGAAGSFSDEPPQHRQQDEQKYTRLSRTTAVAVIVSRWYGYGRVAIAVVAFVLVATTGRVALTLNYFHDASSSSQTSLVYVQSTTTIQKSLLDVDVDDIIVVRGVNDFLAPDARQQLNLTDSFKSIIEINLRGVSNKNDTHGDRGVKAYYHTGVVSISNKKLWKSPQEALEVFLSVISPGVHSPPQKQKKKKKNVTTQAVFPLEQSWHPLDRRERFPSVLQRVALYTGEGYWLDKACRPQHPHPHPHSQSQRMRSEHASASTSSARSDPLFYTLPNGTVAIPSSQILRLDDEEEEQTATLLASSQIQRWGFLQQFTQFLGLETDADADATDVPLSKVDPVSETVVISTRPRQSGSESNSVYSLERKELTLCAKDTSHMYVKYCRDALTLLDVARSVIRSSSAITDDWTRKNDNDDNNNQRHPIPILARFGDGGTKWGLGLSGRDCVNLPIFKKFRNIFPTDRTITFSVTTPTEGSSSLSGNVVGRGGTALQLPSNPGNVSFVELCRGRPMATAEYLPVAMKEREPFVWNLNSNRHFRHVRRVPYLDRPWHHKRNAAVWRGAMSGREAIDHIAVKTVDQCHLVPRCRLVLSHLDQLKSFTAASSSPDRGGDINLSKNNIIMLVDAKFSTCVAGKNETIGAVPIDSHPMATTPCSNHLDIGQIMEYKAILVLEGNDVASGLKWALFSQSVVLMPNPTRMTWAMESLLQPWVHYVPIDSDMSNVEERMQWIIDNDKEAQKIGQRATLFMYDLLYHPDSERDEEHVKQELVKVYWSALK
jgi:hypothetical protein